MRYDKYAIGGKEYDFSSVAKLLENDDYKGAIDSIKDIADLNDNFSRKVADEIAEYLKDNGPVVQESEEINDEVDPVKDEEKNAEELVADEEESAEKEDMKKCPKCGCETTQELICPECGAMLKEIEDPAKKQQEEKKTSITASTPENTENESKGKKTKIIAIIAGIAIVALIGLVISINSSSDSEYDFDDDYNTSDYYDTEDLDDDYDDETTETTTEATTSSDDDKSSTTDDGSITYSRAFSRSEKVNILYTYLLYKHEQIETRSDYDYMSEEKELELTNKVIAQVEDEFDVTEDDIFAFMVDEDGDILKEAYQMLSIDIGY